MADKGSVPKDYDPVTSDALNPAKRGVEPCDNPGIMPEFDAIKNTPGENATNDTAGIRTNKNQPFKTSGKACDAGGYTE